MDSVILAQALVSPTPFVNATSFPASRFFNIGTILNVVTPMLTLGAVVLFGSMLVYGAFTMITASGEAESYAKAKKTLTFAVIGLLTVVFAYLIVQFLEIILNIS